MMIKNGHTRETYDVPRAETQGGNRLASRSLLELLAAAAAAMMMMIIIIIIIIIIIMIMMMIFLNISIVIVAIVARHHDWRYRDYGVHIHTYM
jgi:hypothetical protein